MQNLSKPIEFITFQGLKFIIYDYKWFNNCHGCYGVILAEYDNKQRVYFSLVSGFSESFDINHLLEYGFKLNYQEACGFFGHLINKDIYKY